MSLLPGEVPRGNPIAGIIAQGQQSILQGIESGRAISADIRAEHLANLQQAASNRRFEAQQRDAAAQRAFQQRAFDRQVLESDRAFRAAREDERFERRLQEQRLDLAEAGLGLREQAFARDVLESDRAFGLQERRFQMEEDLFPLQFETAQARAQAARTGAEASRIRAETAAETAPLEIEAMRQDLDLSRLQRDQARYELNQGEIARTTQRAIRSLTDAPNVPEQFTASTTGYFPTTEGVDSPADHRMEGGSLDADNGNLYTLNQYLNGEVPYVTLATDNQAIPIGTPLVGQFRGRDVLFIARDTGQAFEGAGTGRVDIPVDNKQNTFDITGENIQFRKIPKAQAEQMIQGFQSAGMAQEAEQADFLSASMFGELQEQKRRLQERLAGTAVDENGEAIELDQSQQARAQAEIDRIDMILADDYRRRIETQTPQTGAQFGDSFFQFLQSVQETSDEGL